MTYEAFLDLQWARCREPEFQVVRPDRQTQTLSQALDAVRSDRLVIGGLDQAGLEALVARHGPNLRQLVLGHCKLIGDLSPLAALDRLEYLQIEWNQRADALWDMRGNRKLVGLCLNDFTRLHTLEGVQRAPALRHLHFGNAVWDTAVLRDVEPLRGAALESFSFSGKRIESLDPAFFAELPGLRRLDFPSNLFETEDIARLVARAPWLEGTSLRPYRTFAHTQEGEKDVLIVGKRKPWLRSDADAERIRRYEERFQALVKKYRGE